MKLKMSDKGFTLVELLIGISILAFIVGAISMTVITMMRLSPRSSDLAIALRQVQNTGYWISRDVEMSKGNIDIYPSRDKFLTLRIPEWDAVHGTTVEQKIDYEFMDIGGERWLMRIVVGTGGQTAIAQYISEPIQYSYDHDPAAPDILTFTIVATFGGSLPVSRQYQATQRVPP